uniref:Mutant titin-cap n=1 Tax=Homo sapiens TaxID=9606 RepID=A8I423_HUMAN|nr:mutant titin-cap [Homo sapiens]
MATSELSCEVSRCRRRTVSAGRPSGQNGRI